MVSVCVCMCVCVRVLRELAWSEWGFTSGLRVMQQMLMDQIEDRAYPTEDTLA